MNTSSTVSLITLVDDALPARQREQRQVEQKERRRDHPVDVTALVEDATLDQRRRRASGHCEVEESRDGHADGHDDKEVPAVRVRPRYQEQEEHRRLLRNRGT
jgi:hypothetical protein